MLVPVIGLVQVGEQARADRYTYLSQIGLVVLLTWLVADFLPDLRHRLPVLAGLSSIILAALICGAYIHKPLTGKTVRHYGFARCPARQTNPTAHLNLGSHIRKTGAGGRHCPIQQTLKIDPDYTLANRNYGDVLRRQGRLDEAIAQYQQALKLDQGQIAGEDFNSWVDPVSKRTMG